MNEPLDLEKARLIILEYAPELAEHGFRVGTFSANEILKNELYIVVSRSSEIPDFLTLHHIDLESGKLGEQFSGNYRSITSMVNLQKIP